MVLTAAQTTAFFESPDQLGIPHETIVQIQREGIQAVADLADFEKQELQQLADNLRNPGGRIPDPNPNAAAEQQSQRQHSHMESSLRRGWLWHVIWSDSTKLWGETLLQLTSSGIKS